MTVSEYREIVRSKFVDYGYYGGELIEALSKYTDEYIEEAIKNNISPYDEN